MPIYEFYCRPCNTLFSFFSARVNTTARPACPRCGRAELERRPARFATPRSGAQPAEEGPAGLDEERMAVAMESLMDEAGALEESEDPRALARMMRRFADASGMRPGDRMEELIGRLEAGEDPDAVEDELGDALDADGEASEELFRDKRTSRARAPRVDETLHFL